MHGDGRGMSVGEAEQEHYFSPTRGNCSAAQYTLSNTQHEELLHMCQQHSWRFHTRCLPCTPYRLF